jgi:hypothetical protein
MIIHKLHTLLDKDLCRRITEGNKSCLRYGGCWLTLYWSTLYWLPLYWLTLHWLTLYWLTFQNDIVARRLP